MAKVLATETMSNAIRNALCLGSTVLGVVMVRATSTLGADFSPSRIATNKSATVTEQYTPYLETGHQSIPNTLTQVTPVSQLSDIKITDWSFQALKSLIKRYGIGSDNFGNTLQGTQSVTRYEFAALLNTAIKPLTEIIAKANTHGLVRKEDLATLQRLQSEFVPELATLQRRVDNLESQTSQLAAQQFSPTTRLTGEVIFAISGAYGNEKADDEEVVDKNLILSDRVWLDLDTSFNGRDRLQVRLEAENTPRFDDATGTEMTRLGFEGDSDNEFDVNQLDYSLSVSKQAKLSITTDASDVRRVANSTNSFSSSSRGAISRFGRYSPIYRQDFGAALRLKYEFSDAASLSVGLGDANADDLDDSESILDGETDGAVVQVVLEPKDNIELVLAYLRSDNSYGAIAQLILEPIDDVELGLTYLRSYNNTDTGTGSELANDPFNDESNDITTNSYGVETSIDVNSGFTVSGWVGLTEAKAQDLSGSPEATIFNYAVTFAFPDLGKEDSLVGVVIGQPPKVTSNDLGIEYIDQDTSLHLEFFYRFQATDNIAITPGLLLITNPEHNTNNNAIYVGTVRTTLRF